MRARMRSERQSSPARKWMMLRMSSPQSAQRSMSSGVDACLWRSTPVLNNSRARRTFPASSPLNVTTPGNCVVFMGVSITRAGPVVNLESGAGLVIVADMSTDPIREYLREIGAKGGSRNTAKQTKARRKNAKKGGRPKGSKDKRPRRPAP